VVGLFLCGLWAGAPANAPQRERERPQTHTTPTSSFFPFVIDERMNKLRKKDKRIDL